VIFGENFFDVSSLLTKVLPLEKINHGFEELKNPENAIKILIGI